MSDAHKAEPLKMDYDPKRVVRTYAGDLAALQGTAGGGAAGIATGQKNAAEIKIQNPVAMVVPKPPSKHADGSGQNTAFAQAATAPGAPARSGGAQKPPAPISKAYGKTKERPEIPLDLVVMRRQPTTIISSFWSKIVSFFTAKPKKQEVGGSNIIHEDIKISHGGGTAGGEEKTVLQNIAAIPGGALRPVRAKKEPMIQEFRREQWAGDSASAQPIQAAAQAQTVELLQPILAPQTATVSRVAEPPPRAAPTAPPVVVQKIKTQQPQPFQQAQKIQLGAAALPTEPTALQPEPTTPPTEQTMPASEPKTPFSDITQRTASIARAPGAAMPRRESTTPPSDTPLAGAAAEQTKPTTHTLDAKMLHPQSATPPTGASPHFVPPAQQKMQNPPAQEIPSRGEILARLHAKVEADRSANELLVKESVPPEPETATRATISVPKTTPAGPSENPPRTFAPPADTPSPIHTYKTDFVDHIQNTQASTASMLAAEQDAGQMPEREDVPLHPHTLIFAIVGALLFIIGIGGILYAFYYHASLSAPVATKQTAPSLITTGSTEQLSGTGSTLMRALANAATKPLADGAMKLTYITIATTTPRGATTTTAEPGGYLIAAMNLPMPNILLNNIAVDSTVGIIHAGSETRPFFLLHIASYDNTFAGMLRWESTIATDFATIYPPYPPATVIYTNITTTTATSTETTASTSAATSTVTTGTVVQNAPATNTFVDEIISNHDVRVLRDTAGRSILLYGFRNKHTLIIARNGAAFTAILNRLSNTNTP